VLEKNTVLSGTFATEPFEVAWAREARWFFQVLEATGDPVVELSTQISPDGLNWIDLDEERIAAAAAGITSWPVNQFGHWLRVRGTTGSDDASVKVRIYLALKS
jgi:hypothetical protein